MERSAGHVGAAVVGASLMAGLLFGMPCAPAFAGEDAGAAVVATEGAAQQSSTDASSAHADAEEESAVPVEGGQETAVQDDATAAEDGKEMAEQDGDAASATPVTVTTTLRFVGTDGVWSAAEVSLAEGANAWVATCLALEQGGLSYKAGSSVLSDVLVSLANPATGETLESDTASGSAWHLYLNGVRYQGAASACVPADGDELEWRYEVAAISVSVAVVGPGGTGAAYWIAPTRVSVSAGQTAWDVSYAVFEQYGYTEGGQLYYQIDEDGSVVLGSLSTLAENGITGETWQLFVNGVLAEQDAAHVGLHAGDSICWYYVGRGVTELPAFVAQTGAAAQDPATSVRLDGLVTQAWREPRAGTLSLGAILDVATGMRASGYEARAALLAADRSVLKPFAQLDCETSWTCGLSRLLDGKLNTGEGGRAARSLDGSLYYLDDEDALIKLELQ